MSGRIRSIKPEILDDEEVVALSDSAWRLWVSTWALADDYGNLRGSDRYLAAQVWQDTTKDVAPLLRELVDSRRVVAYAVAGVRYLHIRNFNKHQRIDNAGKEKVPGPEKDDGSWDATPNSRRESAIPAAGEKADSYSEVLSPLRAIQPLEGKGGERKGEDTGELGFASSSSEKNPEAADHVFAAFLDARRACAGTPKGPVPVFTPKRRKIVRDRMKAGYSAEQLALAARGLFLSEFHLREKALDFEYAMRDTNLDKFIAMAHEAEEAHVPLRESSVVVVKLSPDERKALAATAKTFVAELQAEHDAQERESDLFGFSAPREAAQ